MPMSNTNVGTGDKAASARRAYRTRQSQTRIGSSPALGVVYAAETGFLLATTPDTVRAPDVAFVSRERLARQGEVEGYWPGAPDLVMEVISPADHYADVEDKVVDWLAAGVRLVVVVNPRKQVVTLYRSLVQITVLGVGASIDAPEIIPGWTLPVEDVFQ